MQEPTLQLNGSGESSEESEDYHKMRSKPVKKPMSQSKRYNKIKHCFNTIKKSNGKL